MQTAPKNIKQLRDSLTDNYAKLLNRQLPEKTAKEVSNMAGKIINSVKVQLDYHSLKKTGPGDINIDFLND